MPMIETKRLLLREMDAAADAAFIVTLLNSPKFIRFIGDRGVRTVTDAATFIEKRYRQSYHDHGFGLYTVEIKNQGTAVGICGFVKRENLDHPDLGFAFLPEYERRGYGLESAAACLNYGRKSLGLSRVLAITAPDNTASIGLLEKLGFSEIACTISPDGEILRVFETLN